MSGQPRVGATIGSALSGSGGAGGFGAELKFLTKSDHVAFSGTMQRFVSFRYRYGWDLELKILLMKFMYHRALQA